MSHQPSSRRIRWGILGTANIARGQVVPAIIASTNGTVAAVASRDLGRAQAFADQFGIKKVHGSYDALIADPDIDAIYNPLPNDGHATWSIAALRAGKPVLCEKPLALTAAEAVTMIDAAKESGQLLGEAFMWRHHPQHAIVRNILASGDIGRVCLMEAAFTYPLKWEDTTNVRLQSDLGGGSLWDVGCYCVNSIRLISGQEPEQVSGFQTLGKISGVDETFVGILQFPGGLLAHFECGMRASPRNSYTITGDRGKIIVHAAFRPDANAPVIEVIRGDQTERIIVPAANQYTLMVEAFAQAILNGHSAGFPPEDSWRNMTILEALARSAREGRAIRT